MALGRRSEPEPDAALVSGAPRDFIHEHPSTALLVVEVASTSLAHDLKKAGLYARAGVPEYWIVDVKNRQVFVHRAPAPMPGKKFRHGYRERRTEPDSGRIATLAAPEIEIPVRDLLP
jgi:Uma2 family endonuclease